MMPDLNREQFAPTYPRGHQLSLFGERAVPEQMRLFDTHRTGEANVYALNPSADAGRWRDEVVTVPPTAEERVIEQGTDDPDEAQLVRNSWDLDTGMDVEAIPYDVAHPGEFHGEFFTFVSPPGSSERRFLAGRSAHERTLSDTQEAGTYLGHDAYPDRVNPDITFDDLLSDEEPGGSRRSWFTPEGTEVGRFTSHEDRWGPQVDYAEINPMYQGRGFSRDALVEVASGMGPGDGILHAGSFTAAGAGAFRSKGVPTEDVLDSGYDDFVSQKREDAVAAETDPSTVRAHAMDLYPGESADFWDTPGAEPLLREAEQELRESVYDDFYNHEVYEAEDEFRGNLEQLQAQMIQNIPRGRRGSFVAGWKPKSPTRGSQAKFPF